MFENWRFNPFSGTMNSVSITDEEHTIEYHDDWCAYGIQLNEAPELENPSSVSIVEDVTGQPAFSEVPRTQAPSAGEFSVDYDALTYYGTGRIEFNAADVGKAVLVSYKGTGWTVKNNYRQSQLTVTTNMEVEESVTVHGDVDIDGETTGGGDLHVAGDADIDGNVTIGGPTGTGDLSVGGDVSVDGALEVAGGIKGDVAGDVTGNLTGDVTGKLLNVDWTSARLVGSGLAISGVGYPALAALNGTDVAFIDSVSDSLSTYRFDGSNWALVGSGLAIAGVGHPALAALNGTDVAFIDYSNQSLRTYRFDGSNWALVGSGLAIAGVGYPALAALNGTDVAFTDSGSDSLSTYRFDFCVSGGPYRP
jgi:cytoskeletal protein CcmA (bactofilin family)